MTMGMISPFLMLGSIVMSMKKGVNVVIDAKLETPTP